MYVGPTYESKSLSGSIDGVLESVLRGAAKTLGCNSANLVVFNEFRKEIQIKTGLVLERQAELAEVEIVLGKVNNFVFSFESAGQTALYRSWYDRMVLEVTSLAELAQGAFPQVMLEQADKLIGERRFLIVPAMSDSCCYGVIIFEKPGAYLFTPQQRELLILYANRIGEILENDSRSYDLQAVHLQPAIRSPVALWVVDSQGHIVGPDADSVNPTIPDDFRAEMLERAREILGQPSGTLEDHFQWTPQGEGSEGGLEAHIKRVEINGAPSVLCDVHLGEHHATCTIQDHLLQIAQRKSAPRLLVDPEYRITSCNKATMDLLGYSQEELIGRDVSTLFGEDVDIRAILNHQFLFVAHGHHQEAASVTTREGDLMTARVEAFYLADEAFHAIGYLLLIRQQESDALHSPGAGSMEQLMRRERLASMGEIAAQLAHEIRNPILAIGATLESMQVDDGEIENSTDAVTMAGLSREINRLDMILRDYLSLSARQNATISPVNISKVVEEASELLKGQQRIARKNIRTRFPDNLEIYADRDGLKQVFFNLFSNALESSPEGSEVLCSLAEHRDQEIVIHVDDSGSGLKAPQERCFTPFYSTKSNGTGLGLTVCRNILTAHSGTLSLENRENAGCRVTVTMPTRSF